MLQAEQVEELVTLVSALDRATLVEQIDTFHASFPVDFTREYLDRLSLDRLRHLFMALCLQQQRMPQLQA
jgi:hypothetical protein